MNDLSVLMVFMMLNGQPVGSTMQLISLDQDCRSELAVVEGINQANADRGVQFVASCNRGAVRISANRQR